MKKLLLFAASALIGLSASAAIKPTKVVDETTGETYYTLTIKGGRNDSGINGQGIALKHVGKESNEWLGADNLSDITFGTPWGNGWRHALTSETDIVTFLSNYDSDQSHSETANLWCEPGGDLRLVNPNVSIDVTYTLAMYGFDDTDDKILIPETDYYITGYSFTAVIEGDNENVVLNGIEIPAGEEGVKFEAENLTNADVCQFTYNSATYAGRLRLKDFVVTYKSKLDDSFTSLYGDTKVVIQNVSGLDNAAGSYLKVNSDASGLEHSNVFDLNCVWKVVRYESGVAKFYNPSTKLYIKSFGVTEDADEAYLFRPKADADVVDAFIFPASGNRRIVAGENGTIIVSEPSQVTEDDDWYVTLVDEAMQNTLLRNVKLAQKIGTRPGQYHAEDISEEEQAEMLETVADIDFSNPSTTADAAYEFAYKYKDVVFTINDIQKGALFRVVSNIYRYFVVGDDACKFLTVADPQNDLSSINYYSPEGHLIGLASGRAAKNAANNHLGAVTTNTENSDLNSNAKVVNFEASSTDGCYYISFETNEKRYVWNGDNSENVNGGNSGSLTADNAAGCNFTLEPVDYIPVMIHADGYGSIVCPVNILVEPGQELYVATINNKDVLTFTKCAEGDVIAPETPIVVKGVAGNPVNLTFTHLSGTGVGSNVKMKGHYLTQNMSAEEEHDIWVKKDVVAAASDLYSDIYYDGEEEGDKITLVKHVPGEAIPAGSMAVMIHNNATKGIENNGTIAVSLNDGINTTEISEISAANDAKAVYDLQGRRLNKAGKGIFIINGKKTIIR